MLWVPKEKLQTNESGSKGSEILFSKFLAVAAS